MTEMPFIKKEDIQFDGNQQSKKLAIDLLDKVLKEQGDLGVYGNLSGGIVDIKKNMDIKIKEENNFYSISIYPKSTTGGHDFSFTINKETGKRSDVMVGEVLPEPDFDK